MYNCDQPIRCLFSDLTCIEEAQKQYEYCGTQEAVEGSQEYSSISTEYQTYTLIHTPVNTAVPEQYAFGLQLLGGTLLLFGISLVIVGIGVAVSKLRKN